jgi:hypothetical protein
MPAKKMTAKQAKFFGKGKGKTAAKGKMPMKGGKPAFLAKGKAKKGSTGY